MATIASRHRRLGLFICLICGAVSCRQSETSSAQSHANDAGKVAPSRRTDRPAADRVTPTPLAGVAETSLSTVQLTPVARPLQGVDKLTEKRDATRDDWTSEVVSDKLLESLAQLQRLVEGSDELASTQGLNWASDHFICSPLCPQPFTEAFAIQGLRIQRWDPPPDSADTTSRLSGLAGLAQAINDLRGIVSDRGERRVKLKLIRIQINDADIDTDVLYEAMGRDSDVRRQQTAVWQCRWEPATDSAPPRLREISLKSFEQVEQAATSAPIFADQAADILGANASYHQQMVPGIHHWLRRITREFLGQFGHHGLAVGDVNGDGRDDLYVCDAGGLPNRLYVQQPDGSALDVSETAGVDILDDSNAALLVDLDNDGDQDLIVIAESTVNIAENLGDVRFRWRFQHLADAGLMSLTAADYDLDGDLDLYACGYYPTQLGPLNRDLPFPWPYHDATNGGRNVLLRNDGSWSFSDVTERVGLDVNNRRFSFAAAWDDYDNDGDLDLYVANDFGRNCLYRNDAGYFHDVASTLHVEDQASGMSVSWGDYNRDGWMDVYIGNMFSAAGSRITHQARFGSGLPTQTVSLLQRMARGNTLFANRQGQDFDDTTLATNTSLGRWAWASRLTDFNNDGWPDILVSNGYLTNEQPDDL